MKSEKSEKNYLDFWIAIPVSLLLALGIALVYTSSYYMAQIKKFPYGEYYYLIQHLIRVGIGIAALLVTIVFPLKVLKRHSIKILLFAIGLLLFVFIVGHLSHGAKRWIRVASFSFQPSEMAKFALIIYLARYLSEKGKGIRKFKRGFLPAFAVILLLSILVALQPALSTSALILVIGITLLFFGGARILHIGGSMVLMGAMFFILINKFPHAKERIEKYKNRDSNYQVTQAHIGMAEGRIFGVGLGRGKEKFLYLPEPHTDFIYAVVGEELGFAGAVTVLLLYLILTLRGFHIASVLAKDTFASTLAFGFSFMIILYAFVNISVVLNIVPTTGLPLPFVSYGGSATLFNLAAVGFLLNLSFKAQEIKREKKKNVKGR
jgi:cell division protein FtsW